MPKIAIIDDEISNLDVFKNLLERKGYAVLQYADSQTALNELKRIDIDIILVDLKMPDLDGLQFLYYIKKDRPLIPVVVMTAFASIETAVMAMKWGAFDYLRKPIEMDKICGVIERALSLPS